MNRRLKAKFALEELPDISVWRLVDRLNPEYARLLLGAVLLAPESILAFGRTGSTRFRAWGAPSIPSTMWRLTVGQAYRLDRARADERRWASRARSHFRSSTAHRGAVSFVPVFRQNAFVHALLIVCQTAFVSDGAVSNNASPIIARGHCRHACSPLFIASTAIVSTGVAAACPQIGSQAESLVELAGGAHFCAKRAARDRAYASPTTDTKDQSFEDYS
jgi:hypothetical protein